MKQVSSLVASKIVFRKHFMTAGMLLLLCIPVSLPAQTDSTQNEEATTEAESSLIAPSIDFRTVQKSDNTIDFTARLNAKVNERSVNLYKMKITFFQVVNKEDKELGFVITDRLGKAFFHVKADSLETDAEGKLHFKAGFAGNKAMEPAEATADFKRAKLVITPVKEDSLLTVQIKLVELDKGTEKPVPETTVGIFVHRLFYPLKVAEGTTDENGEASAEIPNNLPGDPKGNLTLIGRLDENETYGNLEASVIQPWGIPVSDKLQKQPRALWSEHPPLWMLITFIVLMGAVWGHYLVIIIQLFRLRKEEPEPDSPTIDPIFK